MTPKDQSKTTTAIGTIAPLVPTDSATSTTTIEPTAHFVKTTVDPSISCGKSIFEPQILFASAKLILLNEIMRQSEQRKVSSTNQFRGNNGSNKQSNLATSVSQHTSDIMSQVCEGESHYQVPS